MYIIVFRFMKIQYAKISNMNANLDKGSMRFVTVMFPLDEQEKYCNIHLQDPTGA